MPVDEKQIYAAIMKLERERKLLNALNLYYQRKDFQFEQLVELSGWELRDIRRYQSDYGFPHRIGASYSTIKEKIERRLEEIRKEMENLKIKLFGSLDQLIIIPSWRQLLGSTFKGFYINQMVQEITMDPVFFLTDVAMTSFEVTIGEPFMLILGAGFYWVKFSVGMSSLIIDSRELNGLILPLNLYEKALEDSESLLLATSSNTDEDTATNLRMTENFISIPFSIILTPRMTQMRLRGILARNVFHPYHEPLEAFYRKCRDETSYNKDDGLKFLVAGLSSKIPLYYNEILTEKELSRDYMRLTAGIKNIQPKLGKIIQDLDLDREILDETLIKARILANDFADIGYRLLVKWDPGKIPE